MLIISFYTLNTPYEQEAKNLIDSCKKWDIATDIEGIVSEGSWEKNCALKPGFILRKLKEHNCPLLWVDIDAVFKQKPEFSEFENCDFAVRVNEFLPITHESRIVSNAIFVRNVPTVFQVLEDWNKRSHSQVSKTDRQLEFWDQMALNEVLLGNPELNFLPMPLKYSKIFDFDDLFISDVEVILEHYQASRRFKDKVSSAAQDHCCH